MVRLGTTEVVPSKDSIEKVLVSQSGLVIKDFWVPERNSNNDVSPL